VTGPIAVTGAGGYVGGRVVQQLRSNGHTVRPLARHPVPWMSDALLLDLAQSDVGAIADALADHAAVVHLAGASEVRASSDPDGALAETVAATRRVSQAAAQAGIPTFVYLSTVHVYGAALERDAVVDELTLPAPRHPYAVARLASEHLAAAAGLDSLVVLRLTNSVGAPADVRVDRWTLVANDLCRQAAVGGPLRLTSSGRQWRDFVDLGDVCRSIAAAAAGQVPPGVYNLGSGRPRTVLELAGIIADAAAAAGGSRPVIEAPPHHGPRAAPVRVDVSRLARHLPSPAVPLEDSVRELIDLCRTAVGTRPATDEH
jgi:UDP-glucose 4-epimerase